MVWCMDNADYADEVSKRLKNSSRMCNLKEINCLENMTLYLQNNITQRFEHYPSSDASFFIRCLSSHT